jgi:CubicO group peptidase (beta-lactamase class C family)
MIVRFIALLILVMTQASWQTTNAQNLDQQAARQRLMLNKVEYHFNSQQADSIYNLTSSAFQEQITQISFKSFLENELFKLGRIEAISLISFGDRIGQYKLSFRQLDLQLSFQLDSADKINLFLIKPYTPSASTQQLPVIQSKKLTLENVVDSLKAWYIAQPGSKGLAIGVIHEGKKNSFYFGSRDEVTKTIPNDQSVFEIASLTKTFTASLLAYYVDSQLLELDQPFVQFLPDSIAINADLKDITLLQLANHTSGLPRLPANLQQVAGFMPDNPYASYKDEDLLQALAEVRISSDSKGVFAYSNFGYGVLGYVLRQVSGKSLDEMLQEVLFGPLDMKRTLQQMNGSDASFLVPHTVEGNPTASWSFDAMAATGAYKSTLPDLLNYVMAHLRSPVSSTEIALAKTRQFTHFLPPTTDIGLAWLSEIHSNKLVYMHTGATYGSNCIILMCPDDRTGVVILSNSALSVEPIGKALIDFLLQSSNF